MHPNVEQLTAFIPPPPNPACNFGNWQEVETELGTSLPDDFKSFIEVYGTVIICNSLWFHNPFHYVGRDAPGARETPSYLALLLSRFDEMDAVVDGWEHVPFPQFPEQGGLLPIGATDNGDILCWITDGSANEWGTFFWSFPGLKTFTLWETSLTQMLLDLWNGSSPLIPNALPSSRFEKENWRIDN